MSDIDKIKKLRQSTGADFKDCNAALKETDGDLNKAAEVNSQYILKKWSWDKSSLKLKKTLLSNLSNYYQY